MELSAYIDEIKLRMTGYVLELEIEDSTLAKIVNASFREIQRYIDTTRFKTMPYSKCIDLGDLKVNSIVRVYRADGYFSTDTEQSSAQDPFYTTMWAWLGSSYNGYNLNDYTYKLGAWNTAMQVRNTLSTDLAFMYDHEKNYLYVNSGSSDMSSVTIEYVPRFDDVSEIKSDFWIDILLRLSVALTKVTLGRIRSRYTQSNALWTQDGETLLNEGNTELQELRTQLSENTQLIYGID